MLNLEKLINLRIIIYFRMNIPILTCRLPDFPDKVIYRIIQKVERFWDCLRKLLNIVWFSLWVYPAPLVKIMLSHGMTSITRQGGMEDPRSKSFWISFYNHTLIPLLCSIDAVVGVLNFWWIRIFNLTTCVWRSGFPFKDVHRKTNVFLLVPFSASV